MLNAAEKVGERLSSDELRNYAENSGPIFAGVARELLAARAVLEKLPVTADGVRIVPGQDCYRITEGFVQGVNEWRDRYPYFAERPGEKDSRMDVYECFSTRKAATAALAAKEGT